MPLTSKSEEKLILPHIYMMNSDCYLPCIWRRTCTSAALDESWDMLQSINLMRDTTNYEMENSRTSSSRQQPMLTLFWVFRPMTT
jgi:hypothetical protein